MRWSACFLGLAAFAPGPAVAQARAPAQTQPQIQRPAPAPAQQAIGMPTRITAGSLAVICGQNQPACLTYVLGAVDAFQASTVVNFGRAYVCFPPQVTNQQIANVAKIGRA